MLFNPKENGLLLIEYAILIAFFAIIALAIVQYLSLKIGNNFSTIASSLPD